MKAFLFMILPIVISAQNLQVTENPNKLIPNSSFLGFQIEATTLLAISEVGGAMDYNFFSSENEKYNVGMRLSGKYYTFTPLDVGGSGVTESYFDFNFYARHSIKVKSFCISSYLGMSLHNPIATNDDPNILLRGGIEVKYFIFKNGGFIFKFGTSLLKNTTFAGIGLFVGIFE